ncbi:SDR family oxidoreductase [Actinopolymorpha pittospori]|uniref:NAD(P)-dependent dehydrogenase (Short-subunit alcohol dehydrogenase family) n=1 Tax=Actinopolymorpha pittospori TaxID=648752 RepID=A0A927N5Z8_9ACTN|nr:SDR family oxidoreductase [Actinopolymorpha pittospori]MBE1609130.1 NAD(P)-dependent dehydrogenase (short-subunit alcohol dehydrogenase family) [Actinopolymorpha pittospori]
MSTTWLITGASSGFGRLLAERVASAGNHVIAVARRADRLAELATLAPNHITPVILDLTSEGAGPIVEEALRTAGGLDVLVNNAGYGLFATVEQTDDQSARAIFETNFFAMLSVLRTALPALRESAGRIVQVSSFLGQVSWPATGLYSATKSAVELLSDTLALELAPTGVRVSTIQPGVSRTGFASSVRFVAPNQTYAPTAGAFLSELSNRPIEGYGDPGLVVDAILAVVAHPQPPRRLAVGSEAFEGVRGVLQAQLDELRRWEPLSLGLTET